MIIFHLYLIIKFLYNIHFYCIFFLCNLIFILFYKSFFIIKIILNNFFFFVYFCTKIPIIEYFYISCLRVDDSFDTNIGDHLPTHTLQYNMIIINICIIYTQCMTRTCMHFKINNTYDFLKFYTNRCMRRFIYIILLKFNYTNTYVFTFNSYIILPGLYQLRISYTIAIIYKYVCVSYT